MVKVSPKRRVSALRRRNDEEPSLAPLETRAVGRQPVTKAGSTAKKPTIGLVIASESPWDLAKREGASAKQRSGAQRRRNTEDAEAVGETTSAASFKPSRGSGASRPRNAEYAGAILDSSGQPNLFSVDAFDDNPAIYTAGFDENDEGRIAAGVASAKGRIDDKRRRNTEDEEGVGETTNLAPASAKHRTTTKRPRSDESAQSFAAPKRTRARVSPLSPSYPMDDELFICDVLDAIPKDDIPTMEHPIFTLATQPDMREIHYEHNGTIVDIWPSRLGLATIHDKDILIYCISQLIAKKNKGEPIGKTLKLQPHQLLTWARRQTSGDGYRRLVAALDRLSGTRIKTNITTMDGIEFTNGLGLITEYNARRSSRTGQIIDVQITLSEWLFKMVEGANVLTLHRDYFRLRKPIDRRIYELARKHCGNQAKWLISAETLKKKTGAGGTIRHFREEIRRLVETNHLPDYVVEFADDNVTFHSRVALATAALPPPKAPFIGTDTFEGAKREAPGYDVYGLHQEWIDWWHEGGCEPLKDPAKAFLGFCRRRHQRAPLRK